MEKNEILQDYFNNGNIDIEKFINKYYGYVFIVVKNYKNINMSDEDVEEIISDVFFAIWKNSKTINKDTIIKPYLLGTIKNIIIKKCRKHNINYSLDEIGDTFHDKFNIENQLIEDEQLDIIQNTLKDVSKDEYNIFILYYYHSKKIKEISVMLNISESKVKVTLFRLRKRIKKELKKGGFIYE